MREYQWTAYMELAGGKKLCVKQTFEIFSSRSPTNGETYKEEDFDSRARQQAGLLYQELISIYRGAVVEIEFWKKMPSY